MEQVAYFVKELNFAGGILYSMYFPLSSAVETKTL